MANFAVVNNGLIVNTIIADNKSIAEEVTGMICIEYIDEAGIGDSWDGKNFIKVPQEVNINKGE